jgi:hypothetical protein
MEHHTIFSTVGPGHVIIDMDRAYFTLFIVRLLSHGLKSVVTILVGATPLIHDHGESKYLFLIRF